MNGLVKFADLLDAFSRRVGRTICWAALALVLIQFSVVVLRYVYSIGSIFLQESIIYLHAALFMFGASYTLLADGHVRVDIFYREASQSKKDIVNLFGVIFLLIPVCVLLWRVGLPYVSQSWSVYEGSKETSGIPYVYLLKSLVIIMPVFMIIQGISIAIKSIARLMGMNVPLSSAGFDSPTEAENGN